MVSANRKAQSGFFSPLVSAPSQASLRPARVQLLRAPAFSNHQQMGRESGDSNVPVGTSTRPYCSRYHTTVGGAQSRGERRWCY